MSTFLKGYRTIILNVIFLAGVVPVVAGDLIPKEALAYIIALQGVLNLWLRFNTDTPVGVAASPPAAPPPGPLA